VETRAEESDGRKRLFGQIPYNSRSDDLGGFTEIITPSAFRKTLSEKNNILCLYNHDDNKILGSRNAGTLLLDNRDGALEFNVTLPDTGYANDLYELVKRGDVQGVSFGFQVVRDTWEGHTRKLNEVRLFEVSFTGFPAYPESMAITRILSMGEKRMNIDRLAYLLESEVLDEAEAQEVQELIDALAAKLKPKEDAPPDDKPAGPERSEETDAAIEEFIEDLKETYEKALEGEEKENE